jgi:hypothetical protein
MQKIDQGLRGAFQAIPDRLAPAQPAAALLLIPTMRRPES